eukprot:1145415-Pelagomonas_calceolata.AAC.2
MLSRDQATAPSFSIDQPPVRERTSVCFFALLRKTQLLPKSSSTTSGGASTSRAIASSGVASVKQETHDGSASRKKADLLHSLEEGRWQLHQQKQKAEKQDGNFLQQKQEGKTRWQCLSRKQEAEKQDGTLP